MSIVATLLDKARTRRGIPTDMALAERLGRSRAVVSEWRAGKSYPDEDLIVALAELAGDDPGEWLLAIKAVRTDGKAGKVWAALAKRLGAAAAVVLVGVLASLPSIAHAATGAVHAAQTASPLLGEAVTLCIMRKDESTGHGSGWPAPGATTGPCYGWCWTDCCMAPGTIPKRWRLYERPSAVLARGPHQTDWLGWKQRGRYLVSPAGDRISPERMKGVLWRLQQEERLTAARNRNASRKALSQGLVKVVVVDLADWHAQRFGSRAG